MAGWIEELTIQGPSLKGLPRERLCRPPNKGKSLPKKGYLHPWEEKTPPQEVFLPLWEDIFPLGEAFEPSPEAILP